MNEVLYRTKELLERKLGETVNSGNMNAQELDCTYKAVKTLAQIATIEAMERGQWEQEESRRMMYDPNRVDPYYMQESMRRGRNALGQYTSRDAGPYQSYDHGYSGHSVNDVMIMALERSITPDMSEMEKQRIYDQIKMIRERKD
jgi:hypothetical protein